MDVDRPVGQAIGIKESRDIWQNDLVYALCQAVRLLLMEEVKHGRQ